MSELGRIKTLVMGAYCWRTGSPAMYRLGWIGVDAEMNDIMWVRSSDGGMGSDTANAFTVEFINWQPLCSLRVISSVLSPYIAQPSSPAPAIFSVTSLVLSLTDLVVHI